jgi:ACS family tartrate transporter-like MFS transporter
VLLESPGTLLVERWSARLWISRIMISWGLIAVLTGFIQNKTHFYCVRFFLGLGEAGFFPGIIVYLSHWFRAEDRAKAVALFVTAIPASGIFGAPLSGLILDHNWVGLAGWRWVFILEGIPAIILGVIVLFHLTDRPDKARWLADDERAWIVGELEREKQSKAHQHARDWWKALKEPPVLLLTLAYFCAVTGQYGFNLWLPTMVKSLSGLRNLFVTLFSALPFCVALVALIIVGWSSDRKRERVWHTAALMLLASAALFGTANAGGSFQFSLVLFCLVCAGVYGFIPSFWALPSTYLSGSAAAAAIGLINSIGNVGGFVGPYIVGEIKERTHSHLGGMLFLSIMLVCGATAILSLKLFKQPSYEKPG